MKNSFYNMPLLGGFKLFIVSLLFIIIFMFSKTILSLPKIKENSLNKEIEQITKSLIITKRQMVIIIKSIKMQNFLEMKINKLNIQNEIKEINKEINKNDLKKLLDNTNYVKNCEYKIRDKNLSKKIKYEILDVWQSKLLNKDLTKVFRKRKTYFYNSDFNKFTLNVICSHMDLNPGHSNFEDDLKQHVEVNLLINVKNTNVAVFLLNRKVNLNEVLYEKTSSKRKKRYIIDDDFSNVDYLPTGKLKTKDIIDAIGKKPIEHIINEKEILTWVINLHDFTSEDKEIHHLLVYSIDKEELLNKNKSLLTFLLPETLFAISISLIIIFLFFRRILKNLNTLINTAKQVKRGNRTIRSNIQGKDGIGVLGESFDSMLDSFENSINMLDKKVEEKTKKISASLEEKKILLREIHHRVKNNLSLTIGLIELQEAEVEDKKTKKVLIDIQERIYTMELLHRKLYESKNLSDIDFKDYVTSLIDAISKSYDFKGEVEINIVMNDVKLDLQSAMPCGIILNELITNAYKYAFVGNVIGKLDINIVIEDDNIYLMVKDNGKGLYKEFSEIANDTLGLKLINTIVNLQLFGKVTYSYENGAKFIVEGKLNKKEDVWT